jgi:hypothetical protein
LIRKRYDSPKRGERLEIEILDARAQVEEWIVGHVDARRNVTAMGHLMLIYKLNVAPGYVLHENRSAYQLFYAGTVDWAGELIPQKARRPRPELQCALSVARRIFVGGG